MRWIPCAYLICGVASLIIFAAGLPAVAGPIADPLSGIFAFLLALPWTLLLDLFSEPPLIASAAVTVAGIVANFLILRALLSWRNRRRRKTIDG